MRTTFLPTADWQLGKPFASVPDEQKRARIQQERIEVLGRIANVARQHQAEFIVVAGDLFDSTSASNAQSIFTIDLDSRTGMSHICSNICVL